MVEGYSRFHYRFLGNSIFLDAYVPKAKQMGVSCRYAIGPWCEESTVNPFLTFMIHRKLDSHHHFFQNVRKRCYLRLTFRYQQPDKPQTSRYTKQLPILDIGKIDTIKKPRKTLSQKQLSKTAYPSPIKKVRSTANALDFIYRELSLHRKIYLMNNPGESVASRAKVKEWITTRPQSLFVRAL